MHTEQLLRTKKTVEKPETHKRKINKRKTEKNIKLNVYVSPLYSTVK